MARYFLVTMVFMLASGLVFAQELPEPGNTAPVCDLTQDLEVKWGSGSWQQITATSVNFEDGVPGTHGYLGSIGEQTFEAVSPDSTIAVPRKGVIKFDISTLPSGYWWGNYYRIRWRCRVDIAGPSTPTAWTQQSWWVAIISLASGSLESPVH